MFNERTWKDGEKDTAEYMKKLGYKIIYTNYAVHGAELDIVAIHPKDVQIKVLKTELKQKLQTEKNETKKALLKSSYSVYIENAADTLVITEVKARASDKFGTGADAISLKKQTHLKRGAEILLKNTKFAGLGVRFDVASVDAGKVTYIENAF